MFDNIYYEVFNYKWKTCITPDLRSGARLSPKNHQTSRREFCRRKHNFVSEITQ